MSVIYTAQETGLTSYAKYDEILQESLHLDFLTVPSLPRSALHHARLSFSTINIKYLP